MRVNESVNRVHLYAENSPVLKYTVRMWVDEGQRRFSDTNGTECCGLLLMLWNKTHDIKETVEELIAKAPPLSAIEILDYRTNEGYVIYPEWP